MGAVNDIHTQATLMARDWQLIDALRAGTQGMRDAGHIYLPQRPLETTDEYKARVSVTTLYPAFTETIGEMVGRAFAEPMLINDDVPKWIQDEVMPDVDRMGRNFHVWAQEWLQEAMEYGLSHTLVESPQEAAAATQSGVVTKADQLAAGIRPYLIRVHPRDVLGWQVMNGELIQVRVAFWKEELEDEFGMLVVRQIRVYEKHQIRVYQASDETADAEWVLLDTLPNAIGVVPIVTLYTNRTGTMVATPPLRELAHLNAKHWAMQSGVDSLVDTACVPILAATGIDDSDKITIGAKHAVLLPEGADLKYVEHTGAAIGAARIELNTLKDEMRQAGAKLIQQGAQQAKTATQAQEEAARENSKLGRIVQGLEDALKQALDMIALYRKGQGTDGGSVTVQANLQADFAPADSMNVLLTMKDKDVLSAETVFNEAKRRDMIADDVMWDDEQERIANSPGLRDVGAGTGTGAANQPPPGATGPGDPAANDPAKAA